VVVSATRSTIFKAPYTPGTQRELPMPNSDHNRIIAVAQLRWQLRRVREDGVRSAYFHRIAALSRHDDCFAMVRLFVLTIVLVDIALTPLAISWSNLPMRSHPVAFQASILEWHSIGALIIFAFERIFAFSFPRRFPSVRSVCLLLDILIILGHAGAIAVWHLEGAFRLYVNVTAFELDPDGTLPTMPILTVPQQAILAGFGIWRIIRMLTNAIPAGLPRTGTSYESTRVHELVGATTFSLVWITRSADLLLSYLPEIQQTLQVTKSRPAIDVRCYCTDPDPFKQEMLKKMVGSSGLSKHVIFGRPDLPTIVVDELRKSLLSEMNSLDLEDRPIHRKLLTFCGSPNVSRLASEGAARANQLAYGAGYSGFRVAFRTENYAAGSGRAKKKGKEAVLANSATSASLRVACSHGVSQPVTV